MKVILIRHGATMGNQEKRYIGITDEALCDTGIEKLLKNVDIRKSNEKMHPDGTDNISGQRGCSC